MPSLTDLLKALVAKHSMFFSQRWDSLSAADAKIFTQIERDIRIRFEKSGGDRQQVHAPEEDRRGDR